MSEADYHLRPWFLGTPLIQTSQIQGVGTFSNQEIAIGQTVMRLGGNLFQSRDRSNFDVVLKGTTVGVSESTVLAKPARGHRDASDSLNHSCTPNLGMIDAVTLVAIEPIAAGEELTCDYAYWETETDYVMRRSCNCNSVSCRGTVSGDDWRIEALRDNLLRWASPFIRERVRHLNSNIL